MSAPLLGIDIGGTKCAVLRATPQGEILRRIAFPTETALGFAQAYARIEQAVAELLAGETVPPLFGISCGGPLDSTRGVILSPPNLPGWDDIHLVDMLEKRFGGRARLMNDANAGALAEFTFGAGRGCRDMIFLTFGTGLGAGLIINGRVHAGADEMAGEVGHWRLAADGPVGYRKAGSFEGFCSGAGLQRQARDAVRQAWDRGETVAFCPDEAAREALDVATLAGAARAGDALAAGLFASCGERLGQGLSLLIDVLNPEVIVLGGIYGRCEDLLREPCRRVIDAETLPAANRRCRLLPAALGEQIGDYATIAVALTLRDAA